MEVDNDMVADMDVDKAADKVTVMVANMVADKKEKKWPTWSWTLCPTWR